MEDNFKEFDGAGVIYRRSLLPWWIRFFSWAFMIAGVLSIFTVAISSIMSSIPNVSLYGLDAVLPAPFGQLASTLFMALSGLTGFYLWQEKKQAIQLGKICAIVGVLISIATTIGSISSGNFMIRLEIIFLILFYRKLNQLEYDWELTAVSRTGRE